MKTSALASVAPRRLASCHLTHALNTRRATAACARPVRLARIRSADASTVSTEDVKGAASATPTLDDYVKILHQAAEDSSVSGKQVLEAMLGIERLKLKPDEWAEKIFDPTARWKLVLAANSKDVIAAGKGQQNKGGVYFPVAAAQKFVDDQFINGMFLWNILYLVVQGPFKMIGRKMDFDILQMTVGIGPWSFTIPLKKGSELTEAVGLLNNGDKEVLTTKLPFFLYCYADDKIKVARGRSGGLAIWKKVDLEWQAASGVLRVLK